MNSFFILHKFTVLDVYFLLNVCKFVSSVIKFSLLASSYLVLFHLFLPLLFSFFSSLLSSSLSSWLTSESQCRLHTDRCPSCHMSPLLPSLTLTDASGMASATKPLESVGSSLPGLVLRSEVWGEWFSPLGLLAHGSVWHSSHVKKEPALPFSTPSNWNSAQLLNALLLPLCPVQLYLNLCHFFFSLGHLICPAVSVSYSLAVVKSL